ncbi:MAG: crotonase/enoyl-CoA hydratase family protein, partial [Acidimicrobiales bacterium]
NEGGYAVTTMVRAGFELAERVLTFPLPVVMACTGHAVAMGVFLLLSGDHRLGAAGPFKLIANEVAIGLTMPHAEVEVLRQRLTPAAFNRAVVLAEAFDPDGAVAAGFLDGVVEPELLAQAALGVASQAATLDLRAHGATKLRARRPTIDAVRAGLAADLVDLRGW